jgi:hypothetical protein
MDLLIDAGIAFLGFVAGIAFTVAVRAEAEVEAVNPGTSPETAPVASGLTSGLASGLVSSAAGLDGLDNQHSPLYLALAPDASRLPFCMTSSNARQAQPSPVPFGDFPFQGSTGDHFGHPLPPLSVAILRVTSQKTRTPDDGRVEHRLRRVKLIPLQGSMLN